MIMIFEPAANTSPFKISRNIGTTREIACLHHTPDTPWLSDKRHQHTSTTFMAFTLEFASLFFSLSKQHIPSPLRLDNLDLGLVITFWIYIYLLQINRLIQRHKRKRRNPCQIYIYKILQGHWDCPITDEHSDHYPQFPESFISTALKGEGAEKGS